MKILEKSETQKPAERNPNIIIKKKTLFYTKN